MNKLYAVVGPTASGKSSLSILLAKKINAEIISIDSMQIYRHCNIATAKVTHQEMDGISHHMIDIVNPTERFSVYEYQKMAREHINQILQRGKNVVLTGGTGLYFSSIIYDYRFETNVNDKYTMEDIEKMFYTMGIDLFYDKLIELSKEDNIEIHKNNLKRLKRAMYLYMNGHNLRKNDNKLLYDVNGIYLNYEKELIKQNIKARVEDMFNNNILSEVDSLLKMGVDFNSQSLSAIGYREFFDYYNSNASLNEVKENIINNTIKYAKRQRTWFSRYKFLKNCANQELAIKEVNKIANEY